MTSYFPFTPSNRQAPQFTPTLDGQPYIVKVLWNISAQRYYVNCSDTNGNLIFMVPLIENPQPFPLQSLIFDQQNHWVIAETVDPHKNAIGKILNASVINCTPSGYNGSGIMSILSEDEVTYPMNVNPGQPTVLGSIDFLISMTKGYFLSTMIYRNNTFEVNP